MKHALLALAATLLLAACRHTASDMLLGTTPVCDYAAARHSDCPEEPGRYSCQCNGNVRAPKPGAESASGPCRTILTVCDGTVVRAGTPAWPDGGPR